MKKAVVTGSTGFIGKWLVEELLNKGYCVLSTARRGSENLKLLPAHKNLRILELNLDEIESLPDSIDEKFDVFFHLAWEGSRSAQRNNKDLQHNNYLNTLKALHAAHKLGCDTFVSAGSQAEYGRFRNGPVDENHPEEPISEYGISKLLALHDCGKEAKQYGLRLLWPRIFSAYGEYDFEDTFIMTCVSKMLKNESVPLSLCIQDWDFTYVKDVVEAIVLLVETPSASGVYNIASEISRPLKEFVEEIKRLTGSSSELLYGKVPYGPEGFVSFHPVVKKLMTDTGWSPATEFGQGIQYVIDFYRGSLK